MSAAFYLAIAFAWYLWYTCRSASRKLPGPVLGALSPIRHLFFAWRGDLHLDVLKLHGLHGPVVRYAPSKVLFNTVAASKFIYGHNKHMLKAKGYESQSFERKDATLFNCIDPAWVIAKKKMIAPLFSSKEVLNLHSKSIDVHTQRLLDTVRNGQPCEMSTIAFRFSLDVMSNTVLGSSLDLLRHSKNRWLCRSLLDGNRHMYLQMAWPGLFATLQRYVYTTRLTYPTYRKDSERFLDLMEEMIQLAATGPQHATQEQKLYQTCPAINHMRREMSHDSTDQEIKMEAFALLRAGGDTVAAAIAACLFYLGRNENCRRKASDEVRSYFHKPELIVYGPLLEQCSYLRACLDEAMRMSPPAPGVFFRECTQECVIDSVPLAAGTSVAVGIHALHNNPDYFPEPFTYKPERFLEQGCREAFMPFLKGYRSCPAKKLAYPTMLVPLARLLWSFDFKPICNLSGGRKHARDDSPSGEGVLQLKDFFTSKIEGPVLRFNERLP